MNKKIYITSLHMLHGGIEMAITLLANALIKRGYEVEILCTYNLGEPVYALNEKVKVTYLTDVKPNKKEFYDAIKKKNPVLVVKEGLYSLKVLSEKKNSMIEAIRKIEEGCVIATRNEHTVILSKYGNKHVKKISQLHHDHQFDKKLLKDFKEKYGNIDVFVQLTDWVKQEIEEIMNKNTHTKHVVIPNFLPEIKYIETCERENQVVAVGRLHEVKGFLRMLEVWKNVKNNENYVLKIIGDGEQDKEIREKIQKLNLQERVIMTGALPHDQVMDEMSKSKVYLMTSFTEAFPFVLIEAMSMGLPVVAYDVRTGPRAMITDGVNGYLIPDGNQEHFAKKIEKLLSDEELRRSMSIEAKECVKEFGEERVLEKWIDILG